MKIFLLFFFLFSSADLQFTFHGQSGEADRYYRPIKKEFPLTADKKIRVVSKVNKGHMARNNLSITLLCGQRVQKAIYKNKSFCGLTHLSYNNSNEIVTLHFSSYNPASAQGDCSGPTYTADVETKDFCLPSGKKPSAPSRPPQDKHEKESQDSEEPGTVDT